jgi:hypothetical protein
MPHLRLNQVNYHSKTHNLENNWEMSALTTALHFTLTNRVSAQSVLIIAVHVFPAQNVRSVTPIMAGYSIPVYYVIPAHVQMVISLKRFLPTKKNVHYATIVANNASIKLKTSAFHVYRHTI